MLAWPHSFNTNIYKCFHSWWQIWSQKSQCCPEILAKPAMKAGQTQSTTLQNCRRLMPFCFTSSLDHIAWLLLCMEPHVMHIGLNVLESSGVWNPELSHTASHLSLWSESIRVTNSNCFWSLDAWQVSAKEAHIHASNGSLKASAPYSWFLALSIPDQNYRESDLNGTCTSRLSPVMVAK